MTERFFGALDEQGYSLPGADIPGALKPGEPPEIPTAEPLQDEVTVPEDEVEEPEDEPR